MKVPEQLYNELKAQIADGSWQNVNKWKDGTTRLNDLSGRWWKLRYVLDDINHRAYEVFDWYRLCIITENDIDWDTLQNLPEAAKQKAKALSARFPYDIGKFENGVAEVSWQLNPDGRYYMDDDGYGMTDDEEITLYGFVDREMNVITKFRYIGKDWSRLREMRKETYSKLGVQIDEETDKDIVKMQQVGIIGIERHRMMTDGEGVTTLVGFSGCPLRCKYCLNPKSWTQEPSRFYSPASLWEVIKQDLLYMVATGGGVTFGGGEPGLQYEFIEQFREICDPRIKIYIETSLNIPQQNLVQLLPIVDAWSVDIKDMDPYIYRMYTGIDNYQVIENLHFLSQTDKVDKVIIRVPQIPLFNKENDIPHSIEELKSMGFTQFDTFTYRIDEKKPTGEYFNGKMNYGKAVCEVLKRIRQEIASANDLEYTPHNCSHSYCKNGTCPLCESELRGIERKLEENKKNGRNIIL